MNKNNNTNEESVKKQEYFRFNEILKYLSDIGIKPRQIKKDISEKINIYIKGDKKIDDDFEVLNEIHKQKHMIMGGRLEHQRLYSNY